MTLNEFKAFTEKEQFAIVYFSHEQCNVCKVLKPKVFDMLDQNFPKIRFIYVDTLQSPEIAGQYTIFAVPTILGFIEGKEYFRKSRNIGMQELKESIQRPYEMMFD